MFAYWRAPKSRWVSCGFRCCHGRCRRWPEAGIPRPERLFPEEQLTERELEILRLAAAGAWYDEIAMTLGISPRTVQGHMSSILSKLNVTSRSQAVLRAALLGPVPL